MTKRAENRTMAILATDGFEQIELTSPKEAIENAGGTCKIVSPNDQRIQGGLFNPDALRQNKKALDFVSAFFAQKKPVFAICHGPQVLISAGLVNGRQMTGYSAIQQDLKNAGAVVTDEAVVVDEGLVTSRNPDDLGVFNAKIVEEICEGRHEGQRQSVTA